MDFHPAENCIYSFWSVAMHPHQAPKTHDDIVEFRWYLIDIDELWFCKRSNLPQSVLGSIIVSMNWTSPLASMFPNLSKQTWWCRQQTCLFDMI